MFEDIFDIKNFNLYLFNFNDNGQNGHFISYLAIYSIFIKQWYIILYSSFMII